jgi:hypothetical protein
MRKIRRRQPRVPTKIEYGIIPEGYGAVIPADSARGSWPWIYAVSSLVSLLGIWDYYYFRLKAIASRPGSRARTRNRPDEDDPELVPGEGPRCARPVLQGVLISFRTRRQPGPSRSRRIPAASLPRGCRFP